MTKTIKLLTVIWVFLFLTNCSKDSNRENNPAPVPNEIERNDENTVSIYALVQSGGLSISSVNPDIVSNSINLGTSFSQQNFLDKQIKIKNDSSSSITLSFSIETNSPFKITTNRCPSSLSAGEICTILVRFSPRNQYTGDYNEELKINSDPNLSFVLSARVENNPIPTEGIVDVDIKMVPFTAIPFSTGPTKNEITITNESDDKIASAGSLLPNLSGSSASVYSIWLNRCTSPLMPHKSCVVTLSTNRKISQYTSFPPADVTFGAYGSFQLSCLSNETLNPVTKICEDVTAPTLPSISLITQYPSSQSNVEFTLSHCIEVAGVLYKENNSPPLANDSRWESCSTSSSYLHDLSIAYTFPNHLRTIYYWVKDAAGNISPSGSFSVAYYPEELQITSEMPDGKIHVSQTWQFLSSGGVPQKFFTFDDDSQMLNGATITDSGLFTPSSVGSVTIKLRDSDIPSNKTDSVSFNVFDCSSLESFYLPNNACFMNEVNCLADISHSTNAKKYWNNSSGVYSICTLITCEPGYTVSSNTCSQDQYVISLNQPVGNGLSVSLSPVTYNQSSTITYTPPQGFEAVSWTGACAGIGVGNSCVLNNIQSNKTVGLNVQCQIGRTLVGSSCVVNTYTITLNQPTGNGLSASLTTVNYNGSTTLSYVAPTGYVFSSWGGDCSGVSSTTSCVLNNIQSNKTVSVNTACAVNYHLDSGACVIDSFPINLTQVTGGTLVASNNNPNYGTSATVTFTPATGYRIAYWTGDCVGTVGNICSLSNITSAKNVSVVNDALPYDVQLAYGSSVSSRMQMDKCLTFQMTVKTIAGNNINRPTTTVIPFSFDSGLVAYSDSSCGSSISSITLGIGEATKTFYVKTTAAANQSSKSTSFDLTSFVAGRLPLLSQIYVRPTTCQDAYNKGFTNSGNGTGTGIYTIDIDGNTGTHGTMAVTCEMNSSSGFGWTLISSGGSSCGGNFVERATSSTIRDDNSLCGYYSKTFVRALANISTAVMLRSAGGGVVTSSGSATMSALRNGTGWQGTNAPSEFGGWNWNAPCGGSGNGWPDMYQSCGNANGVHWMVWAGAPVYHNNTSSPTSYSSTWLR